ncbi:MULTISPECIES: hypothetical protein [unclassified Leeuwenhoekiella]|uniref:hypothetical protein n=1 Tax=unclassified Leeuwenhoekiella TaxID=2615029 RepID=UPI000C37C4CB|nr:MULTISPECIES: hypothetical protein [unclassified Leeuwenhoekiella]MAW94054.1 hypothetical protein [Leeuwenhoekiella sp.]MBA80907.1 hypothetical protein [Leeuwenhoekiella sp.]|tara:strand:+ start:46507 stop:48654 length:2148 start_codon:yes stop_codon:yes gene_type:complete
MKIFKLLVLVLTVVTAFTACEDDIITNYAFDDISAPQNLNANFEITQDDSGLVTITPVGEGASTFTITSGIEGDTPVTINAGESTSFTYTEGEYLVKIVATGATGLTSEYNQNLIISFTAPENLEFTTSVSGLKLTVTPEATNAAQFDVYFGLGDDEEPMTIMAGESAVYEYAEPGTYDIRVVARAASVNTIELTKSILVAGAVDPMVLPLTFDNPDVNYEFVTFGGVTFEVVANPDQSGANTSDSNVGAIKNGGAQYEGGTFNLGTPVDFSGADKTITMKFWSDTPTPVLLKFEGGVSGERQTEVSQSHNGTGWEELSFNFATDAIKSYIDGNQGVGEAFVPTGQYTAMTIFIDGPGTLAGTFYIDDIEQTGGLTTPQGAAPTPDKPESGVISLFSNAYTNIDMATWRTDWSDTALEESAINGNDVKIYSALNFVGAEPVAQIDASQMTHFRTDIWTNGATIFRIKLVDFGPNGTYQGGDDSEHEIVIENPSQSEWVTLDIPLSDFTGLQNRGNIAQLIYSAAPAGEATIYIDNVIFYDANASAPDSPQNAAPTPAFAEANVLSLFSDAYSDVTMATWRTDWSSATLEDITVAGNAVKKYSALNFVGAEPATPINATSMTHFSTDIWTGDATQIRIKLVDFGPNGTYDGGDDSEHEITLNFDNGDFVRNSWVTLNIPLTDFTGLAAREHIAQLIYSAGPAGEATVFVDNVYFHN